MSIPPGPASGSCRGSAAARPESGRATSRSEPAFMRGNANENGRKQMMLAGKKVVVVGGSSGIGLSTAELCKREGADVIIASRNAERLDAVAKKLNAVAIPADVTSDESVTNLFRKCGPVDHVVVTAAQLRTGPFKAVAMDDVRATMESKFWGAWR